VSADPRPSGDVVARQGQTPRSPPEVRAIEVVGDDAARLGPTDGFLHLRRLRLVNVFADGTRSDEFSCDMVSRRQQDAVAVVVWGRGPQGEIQVALRENLRPPIYLRRTKAFVQPDTRAFTLITEIVAGLLEPDDTGPEGLARRAAIEVEEETGYRVAPEATQPLGGPLFASPGISDEKIHFRHVEADLSRPATPTGDGSEMERAGRVVLLPLDEALRRCRTGEIPDLKTEVALHRLVDVLGRRNAPAGRPAPPP
jgi:ADP-ribose pyrophosphatase